jgi:hypothetical protein
MRKNKKISALALLLIHGVSVFYPGVSYALTNGPTAPESSQFQPASITNLVDPTTGDFSYNIPLLDVDGYPINIAYNSGGGMDDEASWVGYGWNINPGSVSRVMKGIPDDFNGKDEIVKDYNIKPDITGGVTFNASSEVFGLDFLGANASADIFYNNQRGLGVEIGAGISANISVAKHTSGEYTSSLNAGLNLGITSNSQTGADFNFGANLGIGVKDKESRGGSMGFRFGGSLNSRAGMKSTTLGASFNTSKAETKEDASQRKADAEKNGEKFVASGSSSHSMSLGSTNTNYAMAFTPTITMPMKNESYSLSPQAGPEFWGFQTPTIQLTGHYTKQQLAESTRKFPAYGFLHSAKGRKDRKALLDFNREKDAPYMDNTPTLSVPYITQDVFTATSHLGSSQFKAVANNGGVFFDSYGSNTSNSFSLGVEFGIGGGVKGGGDFSGSGSNTVTTRWGRSNDFLAHGDFKEATGVDGEDAYFKLVGEKSSINKAYLNKIADKVPVKVKTANVDDDGKAFSTLVGNNDISFPVSSAIARNKREPRGEVFAPLTASQAKHFALDKEIKNYSPLGVGSPITCTNGVFGSAIGIAREFEKRKAHHISTINVTKNDGMRLIYGVPTYNNKQVDVTMSVEHPSVPVVDNLIDYASSDATKGNKKGTDNYFSQETIPSYATSFLLSGICSPDYVDLTGNGISDDDLGSAVKFNYSMVNENYQWRTPNGRGSRTNYANYNDGNRSDDGDDKASFSYGTKELWYAHSIESKNMIAVFRTSDRLDGYGYEPNGSIATDSKQKKLDRIDLYTKAELLTNPTNPTPIKSVYFKYNYSLFSSVPNNPSGVGKLTLESIYFTYGNSNSGEENRYYFTYNPSGNFQYQQYDKWGTYKDKSWNNSFAGVNLDNNDFPYTVQNEAKANEAAQKWQLSQIELPSGGKIKIDYESDDYAFVQNKRAMQMAPIVGYGTYGNFSNYYETDKIFIKLPASTTVGNLKWEYFEDVDQLYFKSMINLDNKGSNEIVSGYAKIKSVVLASGYNDVAEVTLEKRANYHPIAAAAWQYLRQNLPKKAYEYNVDESLSPINFVKALIAAIRNVGEFFTPFEQRAIRQNFANQVIPEKGFARITNKFNKYGGGLRVKKIIMDDIWEELVGTDNGKSTTTGMAFYYKQKYKTSVGTEIEISSGVASYEPMAGADENPFHQPITYQQKAHLTSSIYTVEEPLGESYLPAPSVCYSLVTIKNLDATGAEVNNGYNVKKFFTAKDFPFVVKRTDLSKNKYNQSSIFGLFNIDQGNSIVLSQGFYVETNDMHGKQKSDETFDGTGKMLSGSYYQYKSSGSEELTLDNNVLTLQPDGSVKTETVGQEFEMYTDMRQQVTDNTGVTMNVNLDVLFFAILTIPIPTFIPIPTSSYSEYRAASTIKVVNKYAISEKVITIDNGSTMTSENVLWDALTGQVLLTKTQNGFDDPLYNFTLPAYLVSEYESGMGAAYRNTGIIFSSPNVVSGQLPSSMTNFIVPGDELGVLGTITTAEKVWAMKTDNGIRLIDKAGSIYSGNNDLILLRSGRRNLIGASTYSVVSLKNPIKNGRIDIDQSTEILSTSAGTFSDEWFADVKKIDCSVQPGCCESPVNKKLNPYYTGLKGNWRGKESYVYTTERDPKIDPNNNAKLPTNTRKGGIFTQFTSFYKIENGAFVSKYQTDNKWIASATVTKVNNKGQEVENKDALNKYSAAQFGFNDLMTTAVASNTRYNEIAYDGFEDYAYSNECNPSSNIEICSSPNGPAYESGHFNFKKALNEANSVGFSITNEEAHTGNYSVKVNGNNQTIAFTRRPRMESYNDNFPKYEFNASNEMVLKNGLLGSFSPLTTKKYILSGWIKGDVATASDPNNPSKAKIIIEGTYFVDGVESTIFSATAVKSGPKVEGWTRVMVAFTIPFIFDENNGGRWIKIRLIPSNIGISPQGGGSSSFTYFDDIRIHPYDANMKSFAYDYKSSRLMAELDENNYATFFEYNDEGQLLRNKKETEKGIVTLKETRSRVRKNSTQ